MIARAIRRVAEMATDGIKERTLSNYKINHAGKGLVNFIDIGSVGGLTSPWRQHADKIQFILNFEPNGEIVQKKNSLTYNTAIWDENCERDFYIYRGASWRRCGSSLFPQNMEYVREHYDELKQRGPSDLARTWFKRSELIDTKTIPCKRLDDVLGEVGGQRAFHFLKVDTQGAESKILDGAEQFLSTDCVGLELELYTIPLYQGIDLLPVVVEKLASHGFELVKKASAHGSFDSQHDCVFLHPSRSPSVRHTIAAIYGLL